MRNLSETVEAANERMEVLESLRESSIAASRVVIRGTKRAIHAIHAHEPHAGLLDDAVSEYGRLYASVRNEPEILFSGPVGDAMMELAEACILSSVIQKIDIPSFSALDITPQAWVLGLADCLGEMRRILLDRLMNGHTDGAKDIFADMEKVCEAVMTFDVPDAILPVRRKQDVARGIMERTRTDITNALLMNRVSLRYDPKDQS
ncbi:MAG: RNA-binding protein [Methanomassiliicoccaceae archaeon]|jgi:translin|nr:RNA-binding protein [Methanomassiliicoccaceae archaeon]